MHLSSLLVDTGNNPDRPRPGRLWLRNLYHVHQRLCMAFTSKARKVGDPDFLAPFRPDDFVQEHVHVRREAETGFLFRIDPQACGRAVILVQSAVEPDWGYAFHNACYLLAAPPQTKRFELQFCGRQRLRFRLAANPTRRLSQKSKERDGQPVKEGSVGKRVPAWWKADACLPRNPRNRSLPMVVMILERVPPSLRGELTRWFLEPQAGVFVGRVSALVRDKLWEKACAQAKGGGCLILYSSDNEQGFKVRSWGRTARVIDDFEGLYLVRMPPNQ